MTEYYFKREGEDVIISDKEGRSALVTTEMFDQWDSEFFGQFEKEDRGKALHAALATRQKFLKDKVEALLEGK